MVLNIVRRRLSDSAGAILLLLIAFSHFGARTYTYIYVCTYYLFISRVQTERILYILISLHSPAYLIIRVSLSTSAAVKVNVTNSHFSPLSTFHKAVQSDTR